MADKAVARADETVSPAGRSDPAEPDELDRLLEAASRPQRIELIKKRIVPEVGDDSLAWIATLSVTAVRHGLTLPELRSLATDLAWMSREAGERVPSAEAAVPAMAAQNPDLYRLVRAYVAGQRLRFDFKYGPLDTCSRGWLAEFEDDALIIGLAAYAALGLRQPHGLELYRRSVASANADNRSRHVCLAAMWLAYHIDEQSDILIALSNEMIARGEADSNVFFRRAGAFRRAGRYLDALDEIDHAIATLDVGNNAVHQDYMREREVILATMQMHGRAESLTAKLGEEVLEHAEQRIDAASAALGERVSAAQAMVSDALLKVVEILGLFVTLLGFLIGSGYVAFKSATFSERVIALTLVLGGAMIFFLLLRAVTSYGRKTGK